MTDHEPIELPASPAELVAQAEALLAGQSDRIANAANLSALLYHSLKNVNWAGFYFVRDGQLIVGPFQGKPACVNIPIGRGVCGAAAETRKVQRIPDVHAFEGHIACDADSRSEIVLPLVKNGSLIGVLDIDSPVPDRFSETDQKLLEWIAQIYVDSID